MGQKSLFVITDQGYIREIVGALQLIFNFIIQMEKLNQDCVNIFNFGQWDLSKRKADLPFSEANKMNFYAVLSHLTKCGD